MEDADVEIVFDDDTVAAVPTPTATPAPTPAASAGPVRAPRRPEPDVLEEIAFYVEHGMTAEAGRRIGALRTLGYGGEELDALEERAAQAGVLPRESAEDARLDEEALRSLTESLDSEMAAAPGVLDAEAAEEQSLADVFAAFKRQVEVEVGGEDFRTYYDLGIAYKEMGLLDDALEAFRTASGSADLFREASSMAAMVHVEKGDLHAAAAAYRLALESPGPGSVDEQALRYALAEVLLQAGETEQARELFRGIVAIDPGYRDAGARLAELEAHRRG
jgi:tetratricopeptide (TPR) repeat protein